MNGKEDISSQAGKGRRAGSFNRDLLVFIFFLFLSFTFWYLNSLKKETEVELRYPVRFVNPPKNREITGDIPEKVNLQLSGHGYSIVKLKLAGNRAPLVIDLSKIPYRKYPGSKQPEYYIVSNNLAQNFTKQLRSEFHIVSVKPDTIRILLTQSAKSDQKKGGKQQ